MEKRLPQSGGLQRQSRILRWLLGKNFNGFFLESFAVFRNFLIFEKLCLQKYYLHWRVNFQFQCAKKMPALTLLISSFTLLCCQQTEA